VQELQLQGRVILAGFLDEDALLNSYAAGDIFVFASRTETQGVCIAEALAAGLPCVVVGAMGAAESITDNVEGFVVPPHDDRFAEAVAQLLENDELRAQMARAAREKSHVLSLETRVGQLLETYRHLLATHPVV
jgi:glycosyltransferase involved in cell wall biosynthesis